jgi:hypothetical protein
MLLKPFDWSQVIETPPGAGTNEGSQLFRFINIDKPYTQSKDATQFVETHCENAKRLQSDAEVIRYASDSVTLKGAYLEFGVCTGKSINFIAALNPHNTIHGFDSFEGLPEDWVRGDRIWPKGSLAFKDSHMIPPVHHNVRLYKGLFRDVLPEFKSNILKDDLIAFLHIDCDLYSSTRDVFENLGDRLVPGSIIVFDELYNYPGSELHEWKAFQEFLTNRSLGVEFIAYNENHEQVAVKIINK